MPEAIAALPRDQRGYPIPFATPMIDGRPEFRAIDPEKQEYCVNKRCCAICGRVMDYWIVFVGGPLAIQNRLFADPALHPACANYAIEVCPYLALPKAQYSGAPIPQGYAANDHISNERPDQMGLYTTYKQEWTVFDGVRYIQAGPKFALRWFEAGIPNGTRS